MCTTPTHTPSRQFYLFINTGGIRPRDAWRCNSLSVARAGGQLGVMLCAGEASGWDSWRGLRLRQLTRPQAETAGETSGWDSWRGLRLRQLTRPQAETAGETSGWDSWRGLRLRQLTRPQAETADEASGWDDCGCYQTGTELTTSHTKSTQHEHAL